MFIPAGMYESAVGPMTGKCQSAQYGANTCLWIF